MAQAAIKAQPAYFQGEEYMLVSNEKVIIEKQVKEQQQKDGDRVRTQKEIKQTPNSKEIHTKTIEVEDSSINNNNNLAQNKHVDFSWLLWAAIIGSVVFFIWRHARRRDRDDQF